MAAEISRRFSLDDSLIDPEIKNRIMSADGEQTVGSWDGESIHDLIKELQHIEENTDPNYAGLPHSKNIPENIKDQVEKDYPVWACDRSGNCLVGDTASTIEHLDQIRKHYDTKYGGIDQFKEKLRLEREEMIKQLKGK